MKTFNGKVAAITGAGSGIGQALALRLAEAGCALALSDVNEAGLAETARRVAESSDVKITVTRVDVSNRDEMEAWATQVVKDHGRVNLIFNNAGVALAATIEGVSYEDFEWIIGINFWGVVYGTKAFLPHLRASGDGHVVNISSIFGMFSQPSQGTYNASKFAVRGFTEALRQELEFSKAPVSATSVHPGGIKTNIARDARFSDSVKDVTSRNEKDGKALIERMFITTADKAAREILQAVRKNQRRVLVGPDAKVIDAFVRLVPSGYQRVVTSFMKLGTR